MERPCIFNTMAIYHVIMKSRHFLILCILILPLSLTHIGCRSGPDRLAKNIPGWLHSIPDDNQYYYAVGISGRTRKIKDAWDQAILRARAELGRTIITHVASTDLIISTTSGEYSKQIIDALSDTELSFTQVIERWYDKYGIYGPSNHYYVLIRLEKKRAEKILKRLR